jgi:hypothetical protein
VIGAVIALYLNAFVLIAQLFMKVPALRALAPTQSEPPFQGTEVVDFHRVKGSRSQALSSGSRPRRLSLSPVSKDWCILLVSRSICLFNSARRD